MRFKDDGAGELFHDTGICGFTIRLAIPFYLNVRWKPVTGAADFTVTIKDCRAGEIDLVLQ